MKQGRGAASCGGMKPPVSKLVTGAVGTVGWHRP
jgi:hypothetical protein